MALAALIATVLAGLSWRWRSAPGARYFSLMMGAVAVYAFSGAAEYVAIAPATKIAWTKISYFGVVSLAPLWLLFALSYSRRIARLTNPWMLALWAMPLAILGLALTNEWHLLLWPTITPISTAPGARLVYGHGTAFWIHVVYAYSLMSLGTYWLIRSALRSTRLFRRQVIALVIAAVIPWLGNLLYIFNLNPWPGLDLTPLAFLLTGLVMAWNIFRFQMLSLVPVAREVLFESLADGVIVLDGSNRIIDLNPTARSWIQAGEEAIGQDIFELVQLDGLIKMPESSVEVHMPLELGEGINRRVFDLTLSPLLDARGVLQGRLVQLHDISRERTLLDTVQRRARQMEQLNTITRDALNARDLQQMLQSLADQLGELFGADGAYLTQWDVVKGRTIPSRAYGPLRQIYPDIKPIPGEKTMTEHVLTTGRALPIEDVFNSPYLSPRIAALFPARSNLALPLIANGEKLGAAIVSYNEPHQFTQDEIALGELAAGQIALAIAKVKLYEAESQRAAQLTALQSISQAVASSLDLDQIFDTVVRVLQDVFGYRYVSIYQLDGEVLRLGAQAGYPLEKIFYTIPIHRGISGRAVREMQPQFVPDVTADPEFLRAAMDLGSEICVPLLKEQTVYGTLNVESPPESPLTNTDLQLLIAFANPVVTAIENARLFAETQLRAKKERTLFDATRDFTARLGEEAVLDSVAHHLVTALNAVGCTLSRWDPLNDCAVTLLDYTTAPAVLLESPQTTYPLADYPATRFVLENRQPLYLRTDNPEINPAEAALLQRCQNGTLLMLPLAAGQGVPVFGLIELFGQTSDPPYSDSDLELAQSLAAQAAVAIENARLYAQVQRLAIVDELTSLYNRRGFFELGQREWERSIRSGHPIAALFVDIDLFKSFNDAYGYAIGDRVLRHLADCLRSNLREIDLLGRYGGEEFVVLLPETDPSAAQMVAERVRQAVEMTPVDTDQGKLNFTISIGVCTKTPSLPSLDALINQAGTALRAAKKAGRNRVALANAAI